MSGRKRDFDSSFKKKIINTESFQEEEKKSSDSQWVQYKDKILKNLDISGQLRKVKHQKRFKETQKSPDVFALLYSNVQKHEEELKKSKEGTEGGLV